MGITLDDSKKKVDNILIEYVDQNILSQDGENYKINKLPEKFELMGLEASKDFLEIINPEAYGDLINSNNTKQIISVANDQLQRKFRTIVGPELIRNQTRLDDFQTMIATSELLKSPQFRRLNKKQKRDVLNQFTKNADPNNEVVTSILGAVRDPKTGTDKIEGPFEGEVTGGISTFRTNLKYKPAGQKKKIPLDVTENEINNGRAVRLVDKYNPETEKTERVEMDFNFDKPFYPER